MLKDRLDAMKTAAAAKVPPETQQIMQQAKEDLAASGILQNTIRPGEKIADFSLPDAAGKPVNLTDLRQQGSVLICIYRGVW